MLLWRVVIERRRQREEEIRIDKIITRTKNDRRSYVRNENIKKTISKNLDKTISIIYDNKTNMTT